MNPFEAEKKENQNQVLSFLLSRRFKQEKRNIRREKKRKEKLEIGDWVRLLKSRQTFTRGYKSQFTEEMFQIYKKQVKNGIPQFFLKDYANDKIDGSFYRHELIKIDKQEVFKINKILKTRKIGGKKEYFVSWEGYNSSFNSWIPEENLEQL